MFRRRQLFACCALVVAAAAACGSPPMVPSPGALTVGFAPLPIDLPELKLDLGSLRLERIVVLGAAPPPRSPMPARSEVDLDLRTAGSSLRFAALPQGIYSRVLFAPDSLVVDGTWRGTPLRVRIAKQPWGGPGAPPPPPPFFPVDLRSATGREIAPGLDASLAVTIDVNAWFTGTLLDTAVMTGGQILCDAQNNASLTRRLADRVSRSFALQ